MTTPTREQVEKLKRQWEEDPTWDIEDTEGYEAYRAELLRFHQEVTVARHLEVCSEALLEDARKLDQKAEEMKKRAGVFADGARLIRLNLKAKREPLAVAEPPEKQPVNGPRYLKCTSCGHVETISLPIPPEQIVVSCPRCRKTQLCPFEPVCTTCRDKHFVDRVEQCVMCTSCPVPCNSCRKDGNGAFCSETPCGCLCHTNDWHYVAWRERSGKNL